MEIPNYDTNTQTKNSFKQKYDFMPQSCFRLLISGNSGSGKTNTLLHMLLEPLIYYDKIYLYAKNLEQPKYQHLINEMEKIVNKNENEISLEDILHTSNDEIIPVTEMDNDQQKVIIFDDYVCEKNQNEIIDYFIQGRHKNCCVCYLSQSYYKTPKDIRLNCSHYIFFESPSKRESNRICTEQNIDKDLYNSAFKKPYDFIYLDKPRKLVNKNFYGKL